MITPLPSPPSRSVPSTFSALADAFIAALPVFVTEANAQAAALTLNATTANSTTSLAIAIGSKSLTVDISKSYQPGMSVKIARTSSPSNWMHGDVTSYNAATGALVVNVLDILGSGTYTDWTITFSAPNLGLATSAQALAGTPAGLAIAPDTLKAVRAVDFAFWGIKNLRLIKAKVGDNTRVQVNPDAMTIPLNIGVYSFIMTAAVDVDGVDDLDTGTQAAGTDYYVYACTDGTTLSFKVSANTTNPTGFDAAHSRKIGGFHTLCTAVGTISGHTLTGYAQKDILPASVWCLKHRAKNLVNVGLVYDSGIQKWVDIYLASGTGTGTTSVNGGTISDTRTWLDFVDDGYAVGKRLLTDPEFQQIAAGSNEQTNITGSGDPGTTGGHVDTAGRRMISNIGCEDCAGVMLQWLQDQSYYPGTPGWVTLPGSKGNLYTGGDVKLLAGGSWTFATNAGSRCRNASSDRTNSISVIGARFVAEPL